ncbi:DHRS2 (predicted) [Pycnogonum litorale]
MNPTVSFILDTEEAAWDKIFEINVKSAFLMTKEIVPHISKRGGGSVVYVSSVAGFKAIGPLSAYSVSKTALLGLTRAVAEQCAPMGIRVNCIAPGIIRTKFSRMLFAHPEAEKKINEDTLLGRIGEASECGGVVSFLCSDDASYITGENLPVTGEMFSRL